MAPALKSRAPVPPGVEAFALALAPRIYYNQIMVDTLKRNYRIFSIIILAACTYFFALPLISPLMEKILPEIWTCPFLKATGRPCPLCGLTRDVGGIYRLETGGVELRTLVIFMLVVVESAARIILVTFMSGLKKETVARVVTIDAVYHTLLVITASVYVIMFLINNFWEGSLWP